MNRELPREPQIQFRAGGIEPELTARAGGAESPSLVARRDLERYYYLLRRALPTFTEPEASLIVDACNGWLIEPHTAPLLWAEVDDAIRMDGLAEKWGVDGASLVARLRALTPFESLAVADAAERFRLAPNDDGQLRRVGLVRER